MEAPTPPVSPQQWKRVMKQDGEEVLTLSIRRPAFPDTGKTKRMERYFSEIARQWQNRWENQLFPMACQALADARETSRPFVPWKAELDYTVTLWQPPLLSLRLDAVETSQNTRPLQIRTGETWDCGRGYPRTLRSFFPAKAHRWRKELLDCLREQAARQLASGESLLDPDCAQVMERSFDPDRFYLTEEGITVFYPLCILGAYAEGIPVFTVPIPDQNQTNACPS
ncbi:MAG: RsiV family protein [Oscillospiraceae bacterium]